MKRFLPLLLLLLLVSLTLPSSAKVRRAAEPVPGRYIVVLKDTPPAQVPSQATGIALQHRGRVIGVFTRGIKGFGIELPDYAAEALALDPRVAWVEEDAVGHLSYEVEYYPDHSKWHLDRIDQVTRIPLHSYRAYGWTFRGDNVNAYVVDTGIQAKHVEFDDDGNPATVGSSRVAAGVNYATYDDNPATNPCGGYTNHYNGGHGTAVASIIGGKTNGVARGVRLVPVKAARCLLQWDHKVYLSKLGVVQSLDWIMADMASSANANRRAVVNMSFHFNSNTEMCGATTCVSALESKINDVVAAGITVVVSANNQNTNLCATQSPARMGYGNESGFPSTHRTITVGGTDIEDARYTCATGCTGNNIEAGSNRGPCVSIYAPGKNVRGAHIASFSSYRGDAGTLDQLPYSNWGYNDVAVKSGTSFSAPVVTGLAARLLQQFPAMTPADVWLALKNRANHPPANFDGDGVPGNDLLVYLSVYD